MSNREELLDMAVHALAPLMDDNKNASAMDLYDDSMRIGQMLIDKVDETVAQSPDAPPRDELMDMGVHAFSALLKGRGTADAAGLLDETMAVARSLIAKVDATLAAEGDGMDREELMDVAVHAQSGFLIGRPKMPADELSDACIAVAKDMIAQADRATS
ncbi:hypothetical protein [Histidinibacterium aquaticum]|uniref:Uncharacterized protein n=1 Tax=Histidinibacterium aquaticum TaxID=2613962 RepID=A0A5J5GDK1_9RHOB|nr:hypothetical protein [Histidinibacterium aquaticum]KAA9005534.1 hypothetical protein F3S47_16645 [Histidinibacterium aquaticum]